MTKIENNFSRQATSYDANSEVQKKVANALIQEISTGLTPRRILDIGCGTGYLTQKLAQTFPKAHIDATDISANMLEVAQKHWPANLKKPNWFTLDGQSPCNLPYAYDLIISNMCIQWLPNIKTAYDIWQEFLLPGGTILTSRPNEKAFWQWRESLDALNLSSGIIVMQRTPYALKEITLSHTYPSTLTFLKTIKASGASTPTAGYKSLTPKALKQACDYCDKTYNATIDWHITIDKVEKAQ